jgi:hypothetical protein
MRLILGAPVLLTLLSSVAPALCAGPELCADAAVSGQRMRRAGKLLEAREQFVACSQPTCAREVAERCVAWLREADAATPTVTVAARDAMGKDVVTGRVLIDDAPSADALAGKKLALDPGSHVVRLETADGVRAETIVLREGERNRVVDLSFSRASPERAAPRGGPSPALFTTVTVGVVATAVFAGFGAAGLSRRASAGCAAGCPSADYDRVQTDFLIADVALGAAVVSLAAASFFFFARSKAPSTALAAPSFSF